jgi:hypothetical protein
MLQFRKPARLRLGLRIACIGVISGCVAFASSGPVGPLPAAPVPHNNDNDKDKGALQPATVRWDEQQPGCTFSRSDDGKFHYGMWAGDVGIVLAVDAREMQIIRHRIEPILAVMLTIRYRGADSLDAGADAVTLQFVKHFKVVQPSLDPDAYIQKIQADADAFDDETRRGVAKHPEEKERRETRLQEYQKSVNELIEFLSQNSLRPAHLDRATPEVRGWVFFDTKSKWLGGWKPQEEFVLRLPLDGKIFEFPFKLPPEAGKFVLQKRQ